jgi:hypothetical protein
MALLDTITKQPREVLDFDISYTAVLAGRSDTLSTVSTEVSPPGLTVVSSQISGDKVKVVFSGGTNSSIYEVTVLTTTTAGMVYEDEVNIMVAEV